MKANIELKGTHSTVLVVTPESQQEEMLLATWMRYDENSFAVSVERYGDGARIQQIKIHASESN